MKKDTKKQISIEEHVGCFGDYKTEDPICKHHCAVNLRCFLEREQSVRVEILEDLISSANMFYTVQ